MKGSHKGRNKVFSQERKENDWKNESVNRPEKVRIVTDVAHIPAGQQPGNDEVQYAEDPGADRNKEEIDLSQGIKQDGRIYHCRNRPGGA